MSIKNIIYLVLGIIIGWVTIPLLTADQSDETKTYHGALRRIIVLIEQVQVTSQQTADNTKDIKELLKWKKK